MAKKRANAKAKETKKARKKTAARPEPGARPSPSLRKKFAGVLAGIDKDARRLCRRFKAQAEIPPEIDEWDAVKEELRGFSSRMSKQLDKYDRVVEQIRLSSDEPLKEFEKQTDALGFRSLLQGMQEAIEQQEIKALAPVSDEKKREWQDSIVRLLVKSDIVATVAKKLESELESLPEPLPDEQYEHLTAARTAVGKLFTAGVALATNTKRDPNDSWLQQTTAAMNAIDEYELVVDEIKCSVPMQAEYFRKCGRTGIENKLKGFVMRVEAEISFDTAIVEAIADALGNALHLPKEAAEAAQKIIGRVRTLQPKLNTLLAELSAVRGDKSRNGDLAAPATICGYHDLRLQDQIVVDLLWNVRADRGPAAVLKINEIIDAVRPLFLARGLKASDGTIKGVVRSLEDQHVLFPQLGDRDAEGHGGAKRYRLTEPAAKKYSAAKPSSERPTIGRPVAENTLSPAR